MVINYSTAKNSLLKKEIFHYSQDNKTPSGLQSSSSSQAHFSPAIPLSILLLDATSSDRKAGNLHQKDKEKKKKKKKLLALAPIAKTLAGKKLCKHTLKLVRKAT